MVSVVIPVYNRETTISRAVNSVLNQSYRDIEVIVVDDASTDNSANIVKSIKDERVRIICLDKQSGSNHARNVGIREAKGTIIAFQDSDDKWIENKLELELNKMRYEKCEAVFCSYVLHENGVDSFFPNSNQKELIQKEGIYKSLRYGNFIGTPTLLIQKDSLDAVGGFDESLPRLQDYDLAIRVAQKYRIAFLDEVLLEAYTTDNGIGKNQTAYDEAVNILLAKYGDYLDVASILDYAAERQMYYCDGSYDNSYYKRLGKTYAFSDLAKKCDYHEKVSDSYGRRLCQLDYEKEIGIEYILRQLKNEQFLIYGSGDIARRVYKKIVNRGLRPKNFVVSKLMQPETIDGIGVKDIGEVKETDITIIISVSYRYQREIVEVLEQRGFVNFFVYTT